MSFWAIVETVLIKPLQLLFEIIYMTAYDFIGDPGLTIIVLSLVMNFLVLPLYKRADAMQEEEQAMEKRLRRGVAHIKKTFSGDEKMMMLQTYYRQNNYKPTYVLRSAVSLFLEIPFFMAAYAFLSKLQLLEGVAFGPIADLGSPDGMLTIGGLSVNVLPFVMTAVNLVSCAIFTKGSTTSSKLQLYGMAIFFLIFLYDSPSGLVFYWTLNNVFSLVKTIFYKLKNPGRILRIMAFAAGLVLIFCGIDYPYPKGKVMYAGLGMALMLPLVYSLVKSRLDLHFNPGTPNQKIFFAGALFLALLTGALIPSSVINASPQEFVDLTYFHHPLWFVVSSFSMAFGTFVVWAGVFYWLAKPSGKAVFDKVIWILCGVAVVDYMFFGKDLGFLSSTLQFDHGLDFTWGVQLINLSVLAVTVALFLFVFKIWKKNILHILIIFSLTIGCMSVLNIGNINNSIAQIEDQVLSSQSENPRLVLSKSGENVIVLMLDMAMGEYIPYIMNEKPELEEQFDGFTYYSNVVSFGGHTLYGTPGLFGGYEYTPYEMNKRDHETMVSKHNEALKVMPVLFSENGYQSTVIAPPLVNYHSIPDLSIFSEYPEINAYVSAGTFSYVPVDKHSISSNGRNFFCYGLLKSIPVCLQESLYDDGNYCQSGTVEASRIHQVKHSTLIADGLHDDFIRYYSVLNALPQITDISESTSNQFIMMTNDTPHEGMILQKPDYLPVLHVDNTAYETNDPNQYVVNGRKLKLESDYQVEYYHSNMATMLQLGRWFDYLRQNDVYDNTRIILVSDHGYNFENLDELILSDGTDASFFYPLLMVKDFNSTGFTTSDEFMTNSDVPSLAVDNVIDHPINPFTHTPINSDKKAADVQYIFGSHDVAPPDSSKTTFSPAKWYSVHDNIWDPDNWEVVAENAILPDAG